jgi:hypothetical protein
MSSTRKTSNNNLIRQERFSSSPELVGSYILGNVVAKRLSTLTLQWQQDIVLFLQDMSLRHGFTTHPSCNQFPAWAIAFPPGANGETGLALLALELLHRAGRDATVPARRAIENWFIRLALEPSNEAFGKSGVPNLTASDALRILQSIRGDIREGHLARVAKTSVAERVFDLLEYCQSCRGLVIAEGAGRLGKSLAAQAWVLQQAGRWRYVQLSSCSDEESFYRQIGRSLGVSTSLTRKAAEMRERIEAMLVEQHVGLVIDEAAYCLPQSFRTKLAPQRLCWIMTSLLNRGVPIALIATYDWSRIITSLERTLSVFSFNQWHGRTRLKIDLGDCLSESDLVAVAKIIAPEADDPTVLLLAAFAMHHSGFIGSLESVATRARYLATKYGENLSWDFVVAAATEIDPTFSVRLEAAKAPRTHRRPPATVILN